MRILQFGAVALVTTGLLTACAVPSPSPTVTVTVDPGDSSGTAEPTPEPSETSEPEPVEPVATIPGSCNLRPMIAVIRNMGFPGAVDVTPPWTPANGTTLKISLDSGGRACAWGIPNTDGGVVVWWTLVTNRRWDRVITTASGEGAAPEDIAGLAEDEAYFLYEPMGPTNEFPFWQVDARFGSLWLHVATSSWTKPNQGNPVIKRALKVAGL